MPRRAATNPHLTVSYFLIVVDWEATHFHFPPWLAKTSVQRSLVSIFSPFGPVPTPVHTPVTIAVSALIIRTFISLSSERVNLLFFVSSRDWARVVILPSTLIADQESASMASMGAGSLFKAAAAQLRSISRSACSTPPPALVSAFFGVP